MPPRRSHKKSRAGCRRCKTRKIKCDEIHPRCGNCVKHGVLCDFERPEVVEELQASTGDSPAAAVSASAAGATPASPAPASPTLASPTPASPTPASPTLASSTPTPTLTPVARHDIPSPPPPLCRSPSTPTVSAATPPDQRMLELRLMHHYTALTCKTFTFTSPGTEDIWKVTVPSLAFSGSQHLADAVLAIAALHLRSLAPDDMEVVRASHAYMAASIAEYNATLDGGIGPENAEALFLTSTLIAFQATATRTFIKDEPAIASSAHGDGDDSRGAATGGYAVPFSWFHAFQGVKAITAASWRYLRHSAVVTPIINSQVALQLDFRFSRDGFFGHLLDGLEEELAGGSDGRDEEEDEEAAGSRVDDTRQAYQHAVAALNWAHKIPHRGAALSFPATVSRRFVELLEERRPRALAVLACFFAQLKALENVWWLHGMARREVLGVVALFSGDYFGPDAYRRWWPHLEWAARIAVWEGVAVPPDVWGADWAAEEQVFADGRAAEADFVSQIELLTQMTGSSHSLPVVPPEPPV